MTRVIYLSVGLQESPVIVGMAAVFAGAVQAPISAILIMFEMTGEYKIMLPLMIACVISTLVVKWLSSDSIYTMKLTRRGIDILNLKNVELLEKIKVSEAMFRKVITINESKTVSDAESLLKSTSHRGFPVLDSNGRIRE